MISARHNGHLWSPGVRRATLLALLALLAGGCDGAGSRDTDGAADGAPSAGRNTGAVPLHFAAVLYDRPFARDMVRGMERAAAEEGVRLEVRYHPHDIIEEARRIREFIAREVDALLVTPQDPDASVTAVKEAHDADIPVVCLSTCLNKEDSAQYITGFYDCDPVLMGYRTGTHLAQWLAARWLPRQPPGSVVNIGILHCDRYLACIHRVTAFRAALSDGGVEWNEVAYREGFNAEPAIGIAEDILRNTEPRPHVLWAANEGGTEGAVNAVRRLGLGSQVYVFGTDIHPRLAGMLLADDEVLQAVTGQDPYGIGFQAIRGATAVARGELGRHRRSVDALFFPRADRLRIRGYLEKTLPTGDAGEPEGKAGEKGGSGGR